MMLYKAVTRDLTGRCWLYDGTINQDGYGKRWFEGKVRFVHRVAYEIVIGPIPPGQELDHLCRNRACYNPFHLEAVSHQENCRRGLVGTNNQNAHKTACKRGHPFDANNTYWHPNGSRRCRACLRIYEQGRKR